MGALAGRLGLVVIGVMMAACGRTGDSAPLATSTGQGITVEVLQVEVDDESTTVRMRLTHSEDIAGIAPENEPNAVLADGRTVGPTMVEYDHTANEAEYTFPGVNLRLVVFEQFLVAGEWEAVALLDLGGLIPADVPPTAEAREFAIVGDRELVPLTGGPIVGAIGLGFAERDVPNRVFFRLLSLGPFSGMRFAVAYSDGSVERGLFLLSASEPISLEQPNLFESTVAFRLENHQRQLAGEVRLFRGPVLESLRGMWLLSLD